VNLTQSQLKLLMADNRIHDRAKLECYLLVGLEVRKAALIMVPAEIPGLEGVGPEIDNEFYWRTTGRRDPSKPYTEFVSTRLMDTLRRFGKKSLPYKTQLLREIFDRKVISSPEYKAHLEWARDLGLRYKEKEVRPTIREIWIYTESDVGAEIDRLDELRKDLRFQAIRHPRPSAPPYYRVFPEEASPEFVRAIGEILGYPTCCLNKYVADRASMDVSVEMRAASQVEEHRATDKPVAEEAYFVRDFFPCTPDCAAAQDRGREAKHRLCELGEDVCSVYSDILAQNLERVVKYPEIIRAHAEGLAQRASMFVEDSSHHKGE